MVYKKLSYTDSLGNNIEHNLWHKIEIDGELSLKEMLQKLKEEKHIDCSMISCGESLVYADFMPNLNLNNKERSDELVSTLIERSHKMKFDPK
ncbi:MAG: E1 ubiquitin-activating protein, partial [Paramarteilia canceri]